MFASLNTNTCTHAFAHDENEMRDMMNRTGIIGVYNKDKSEIEIEKEIKDAKHWSNRKSGMVKGVSFDRCLSDLMWRTFGRLS